jgi:uncharacterized glyoxalase superfamily protein PhnB
MACEQQMPGGRVLRGDRHSSSAISCGFYVYVEDVDGAFARAVAAGATVKEPVADKFWGDRVGSLFDPSGHIWMLATHVEDLSPEEMRERARQAMEKMLLEVGRP